MPDRLRAIALCAPFALIACGPAQTQGAPPEVAVQAGSPTAPASPAAPVGYGHEDASPPQEASHGAAPAAAPEAEPLLNALVSELQQNRADYEAAIAHATPLLHKSLLSPDGASVTADLRRFSFKKAFDNAGHYALPVRVLRVRPSHVTGIGFGPTAERGRVVDYFIAKREGVAGMPAPVSVFFPEGGGPAKIAYVGSL